MPLLIPPREITGEWGDIVANKIDTGVDSNDEGDQELASIKLGRCLRLRGAEVGEVDLHSSVGKTGSTKDLYGKCSGSAWLYGGFWIRRCSQPFEGLIASDCNL